MLSPGTLVGDPSRRYQIVRAIGRGGMGEVYEAVQVALNRRVALKTIRDDLAARPDLLARFRREAESAAALGHPNLVQVTDFQVNPGEPPFLVMEMLDGTTVKDELERAGRLDPTRAAFIGVQVLSGLAAAHRAGIVHRDVKPANLFLQSTSAIRDIVKVLDFGVAKLAMEAAPAGAEAMTRVGQVLGTLSYMAPEQGALGGTIDGRTDLYAVGATLFHALAGMRPFEATEPGGARAPLARIAPWVHRDLAAIVERALERSPDARWPSADAMGDALAPFAGTTQPGPFASSPDLRPSRPHAPSGWDPSAIGRLEASTAGGHDATNASRVGIGPDVSVHHASHPLPVGAVPYQPPPGPAYLPPPGAYGGVPVQPWYGQPLAPFVGTPAPRNNVGKIVAIAAIAVVVLSAAVPSVISLLAVRNATDPSRIATTVDKQMLLQTRPACPAPDSCTVTRKENGLTYPLCTRKLPALTPYKPGDFVLAGEEPHIGVIMSDPTGSAYRLRMLSASEETTVEDEAILGRVCTPGVKRAPGGTSF